MRMLIGFAAAVLVAAVAGCGDKGGDGGGANGGGGGAGAAGGGGPAGVWVIDASGLKESMRPAIAAEFEKVKAGLDRLPPDQRAMGEKMVPGLDKMLDLAYEKFSQMRMEMTLESGGAASFQGDMAGAKESGKGKWRQEGDKILITPTEKNGKPTTDAEKLDVPPLFFRDGKLWIENPGMSIPFKRK